MSRKRQNHRKKRKQSYQQQPQVTNTRKYILDAKTHNQQLYIDSIHSNKIVMCHGPAGTGKTHIASSMAMVGLMEKKYDNIIIARPQVEADESSGFLPGDILKKLNPYIRPVLEEMKHYYAKWEIDDMLKRETIQVVPFGFMRGWNFHNTFVVADECQNATKKQLKMLLTRFGRSSKMVLTGDFTQSDLNSHAQGGFQHYIPCWRRIPNVGVVELTLADVVREPIVADLIRHMENFDERPTRRKAGTS